VLLRLKAEGVKFKIYVKDSDDMSGDDYVDGFVRLLQLTPAFNSSIANWTTIHMLGIRIKDSTRYTPNSSHTLTVVSKHISYHRHRDRSKYMYLPYSST